MKRAFNQGVARIVKIQFIIFMSGIGIISHAQAQTQLDSLVQDSVAQVIKSEEIASSIPSDYAELRLAINSEYYPRLQHAKTLIRNASVQTWQRKLRDLESSTKYTLSRDRMLMGIESLIVQWESRINEIEEQADLLRGTTDEIVNFKKELANQEAKWSSLTDSIQYGTHPEEIDRYINTSIDTLRYFIDQSTSLVDTMIRTFSGLVELHLECQNYLDLLKKNKQQNRDSLVFTQITPIWKSSFQDEHKELHKQINYFKSSGWEDARIYLRENKSSIVRVAIFFLISLLIMLRAKNHLKRGDLSSEEIQSDSRYVHIPVTMSVLFGLIAWVLISPIQPPIIDHAVTLLFMICMLSIFINTLDKSSRLLPVLFTLLIIPMTISESLGPATTIGRVLALGVTISAVIVINRLRIRLKDGTDAYSPKLIGSKLLGLMYVPLIVASVVAFGAIIIGYSQLGMIINRGVISTLLLAMLLISVLDTTIAVIYLFLNSPFASKSNIIQQSKENLIRQFKNLARLIIYGLLIYFAFTFFLLWDPFFNVLKDLWEWGYTFGSLTVTVGSVIELFLITVAFWLIGSIIKEILNKEIFARINMPRGIGNAIASVVLYVLVVVGIFLALASAGFELAHLGILAGALGVGIGIGLQSIINNFISGLILVFERPITVGDIIQVDGITGTVTTIGIRSTTVLEFNGDETIVPNADLISKRVTNWTLSSSLRRYELTFQTNRNVDPESVLQLISDAASSVDGVQGNPPVHAYFKGMEDQALAFYIHYWGIGDFLSLKSNVEKAVFTALRQANIGMHIPIAVELPKIIE